MRKILGVYKNGNYRVVMFDDGTKIRVNKLDNLTPAFPESIDMKICNRCDRQCPMCHECSTPDGELADLDAPFLDTLKPYTELALGGGNPMEHPGLFHFLERMRKQKVICNMTVHLEHFKKYYNVLRAATDDGLIHGLGISVQRPLGDEELRMIQSIPNAVIHVIAGLVSMSTLRSMSGRGIKLLILGYKLYGRGEQFFTEYPNGVTSGLHELEELLPQLKDEFELISFDNLAIWQLHVSNIVSEEQWEKAYMGNDGQYTMYVDLVKKEYAVSSTSTRHPIVHDNIEDMFASVRQMSGHQ